MRSRKTTATIYIDRDGDPDTEVEIVGTVTPGSRPSRDEAGEADDVTLESATIEGRDVLDGLSKEERKQAAEVLVEAAERDADASRERVRDYHTADRREERA